MALAVGKNRTWVVAHPEQELSKNEEKAWTAFFQRRVAGEPCAYIIGEREFFGRSFHVDRRALIPRPSTEGLVELTMRTLDNPRDESIDIDTGITAYARMWGSLDNVRTVIDCGTGSGCIAVTLACELPDFTCIATDISADALEVAKINATRHGVGDKILFKQGSALDPINDIQEPFLLVSNPPYIPERNKDGIMEEVRLHEPHVALFGGEDGTDIALQIAKQAKAHPFCRGIVLECETEQIMKIARELV